MAEINDGGHAFPQPIAIEGGQVEHPSAWGGGGMSLRDYFAAQTIAGSASEGERTHFARLAANAYEIADAMLAARAQGAPRG